MYFIQVYIWRCSNAHRLQSPDCAQGLHPSVHAKVLFPQAQQQIDWQVSRCPVPKTGTCIGLQGDSSVKPEGTSFFLSACISAAPNFTPESWSRPGGASLLPESFPLITQWTSDLIKPSGGGEKTPIRSVDGLGDRERRLYSHLPW